MSFDEAQGLPPPPAGYRWGSAITWDDTKRGDEWQGRIYPHTAKVHIRRGDKIVLKYDHGTIVKTKAELSKNGFIVRGKILHQVKDDAGNVFSVDLVQWRKAARERKERERQAAARKAHLAKGKFSERPRAIPPLSKWRHDVVRGARPGNAAEIYTLEWELPREPDRSLAQSVRYLVYRVQPEPGVRVQVWSATFEEPAKGYHKIADGSKSSVLAATRRDFARRFRRQQESVRPSTDRWRLALRDPVTVSDFKGGMWHGHVSLELERARTLRNTSRADRVKVGKRMAALDRRVTFKDVTDDYTPAFLFSVKTKDVPSPDRSFAGKREAEELLLRVAQRVDN